MHQPTVRVLQLLELVGQNPEGLRLADIHRTLEIPKSTLVPILQTLCDRRYLTRDGADRYLPGTALFSLGAAFSGQFPVLTFVRQQLQQLVDRLGETCYFGVPEGGQVLYVDKVDSPQPLRMLTAVGHRLPAYATGIGKALLSDCPEAQLRQLYPEGLTALTPHTLTDITVLARQLEQAKTDGYTWEVEESTEHIRCFAVPIRKHGRIVAAVSVSVPTFRYRETDRETFCKALQETAARMSKTIEETDAHFGESF